jgi:hypothetical protein
MIGCLPDKHGGNEKQRTVTGNFGTKQRTPLSFTWRLRAAMSLLRDGRASDGLVDSFFSTLLTRIPSPTR